MKNLTLPQEIVDYVKPFYSCVGRYYHDWSHIEEMFEKSPVPLTVEQQWAILFHDIIYIPTAPKGVSENMSCSLSKWAREEEGFHYPPRNSIIVGKIIRSTIDHIPHCPEAEIVLDLDLMRFADDKDDWFDHGHNIRKEYAHVWEEDFAEGRIAVLQSFLDRPNIYYTKECRDLWEEKARINLKREISQIKYWKENDRTPGNYDYDSGEQYEDEDE